MTEMSVNPDEPQMAPTKSGASGASADAAPATSADAAANAGQAGSANGTPNASPKAGAKKDRKPAGPSVFEVYSDIRGGFLKNRFATGGASAGAAGSLASDDQIALRLEIEWQSLSDTERAPYKGLGSRLATLTAEQRGILGQYPDTLNNTQVDAPTKPKTKSAPRPKKEGEAAEKKVKPVKDAAKDGKDSASKKEKEGKEASKKKETEKDSEKVSKKRKKENADDAEKAAKKQKTANGSPKAEPKTKDASASGAAEGVSLTHHGAWTLAAHILGSMSDNEPMNSLGIAMAILEAKKYATQTGADTLSKRVGTTVSAMKKKGWVEVLPLFKYRRTLAGKKAFEEMEKK